ncbi:cell division protein FtsQ [Loktanella fryxellensis]|uniref:Cell division protein FtsQ n=1 Tax=Loktanella fryxellensis TaxID=245187 RepID=A0A1H7Z4Y7_9RHOB|nr:cell division protein FtsQ/DivIB [Loktanella fryxellensis]SEM53345.1 cell division protein FtsQ [Loktanella fryxellensis]
MRTMTPPRAPRAPRTRPLRDPAPSKWGYRWQRWMLTPGVRTGVYVGGPVLGVVLIAALWLAHDGNRAMVTGQIERLTQAVQDRPEFRVTHLAVTGADEDLAGVVTDLIPVKFPVSSFTLDLAAMRAKVAELPAVEDVYVRVGDGGALEVGITPRQPVALWRTSDGLQLIDGAGVFSGAVATRAERRDLPLIAGEGAEDHLEEALALFRTAAPIAERVRGLVRIGERRWDMVLDRDQRILLPTYQPAVALNRVIGLEQSAELLARDVMLVDMRNPQRPTVRVQQGAVAASRNAMATGAND